MATHSSILAWEIPWTEEPDRLQSMGSQRVRHDWVTDTYNTHLNGRCLTLMGLQIRDVIWKPKVFLQIEKFNMYHVVVKQAKSMTLESPPLMWPKLLILSVSHLRNWVITKMENNNICKDCSTYMTYSKSLRNKTHKLLSLLFDQRALGSPLFFFFNIDIFHLHTPESQMTVLPFQISAFTSNCSHG